MTEWVRVWLIPVEIFGGCDRCEALGVHDDEWGFGIMDSIGGLSDCNRAEGFIFRADDNHSYRWWDEADKTRAVEIMVRTSDLSKLGSAVTPVVPSGTIR